MSQFRAETRLSYLLLLFSFNITMVDLLILIDRLILMTKKHPEYEYTMEYSEAPQIYDYTVITPYIPTVLYGNFWK
jgi:hypothetical protein